MPPDAALETPGVSAVEHTPDGWKLTRRSLIGIIAAGAFTGLPRPLRAAGCSTGAFAHGSLIGSLSFFPDGKTLISAGQDSFVKFWTIPNAALFRTVSTSAVPVQVAVSPDGSRIAVAMTNGHLELWSSDGGTRRTLAGDTDTVNGIAFSPDSARLVSVSQDRTTRVWSVADAKLLRTFADTAGAMLHVAVPRPTRTTGRGAPLQRFLVTSGGQLYLRSLSTGATLKTAAGSVFAVSPDGQFLAAHDATRLYMYAFPSLTPLVSVMEQQTASSLAFSADGKLLGIAYTSAPARLYPVPDLTLIRELGANQGPSLAAAMDPQNRYLAISSGKNIQLYQLPSGNLVPVCFMDIAASSPSSSGTQYIVGGVVYTVGCGVPTPAGVACSCNCVPGDCPCVSDTGCSCVSDTGCSCVSDTGCSCVSDTGCSCVSDTGCGCVGDVGCSCDSDYGCGCVGDTGCGCDGDAGCGCDGDVGCSCDGDVGCGCVDDQRPSY